MRYTGIAPQGKLVSRLVGHPVKRTPGDTEKRPLRSSPFG
nr:MAG TPA: hypothetical protein [Caudoviricetes sp.]